MKKPRNGAVRWDVYFLRRRLARLGTVNARDRRKALRKAIKQFDIPMQDRIRVAVEKAAPAVASPSRGPLSGGKMRQPVHLPMCLGRRAPPASTPWRDRSPTQAAR
jgi:hypothetical protein